MPKAYKGHCDKCNRDYYASGKIGCPWCRSIRRQKRNIQEHLKSIRGYEKAFGVKISIKDLGLKLKPHWEA